MRRRFLIPEHMLPAAAIAERLFFFATGNRASRYDEESSKWVDQGNDFFLHCEGDGVYWFSTRYWGAVYEDRLVDVLLRALGLHEFGLHTKPATSEYGPEERKPAIRVRQTGHQIETTQNADGSFLLTIPDLPGCAATGATKDEAQHKLMDAVAAWYVANGEGA